MIMLDSHDKTYIRFTAYRNMFVNAYVVFSGCTILFVGLGFSFLAEGMFFAGINMLVFSLATIFFLMWTLECCNDLKQTADDMDVFGGMKYMW